MQAHARRTASKSSISCGKFAQPKADNAPAPPVVEQAYRGTRFLIADASARALLVGWLPAQIDQTYADAIYLIDPKGHLMMRFSMELTPNRMQKDVARLLKWSGSG